MRAMSSMISLCRIFDVVLNPALKHFEIDRPHRGARSDHGAACLCSRDSAKKRPPELRRALICGIYSFFSSFRQFGQMFLPR